MSQSINIFFEYNNDLVGFQAFPDMMFAEIALKFFNRIGALHEDYKFFSIQKK